MRSIKSFRERGSRMVEQVKKEDFAAFFEGLAPEQKQDIALFELALRMCIGSGHPATKEMIAEVAGDEEPMCRLVDIFYERFKNADPDKVVPEKPR